MAALALKMLLAALMSLGGRLIKQTFIEAVLIDLMLTAGDKLASMTSNNLDNKLMSRVRAALNNEPQPEVEPPDYERLILEAAARRDYHEAARLQNERDGIK